MSAVATTEGVVLRSMKYRETSKIVTFYTRKFGKVSGMVKGARRAKNSFGSSLEPMSYVTVVVYKKAGRELQTIAQCDIIKPFRHLMEDIDRMAAGISLVELSALVAHEEEENPSFFDLLVKSLEAINLSEARASNIVWYFELKLAKILGFGPTFGRCAFCGTKRRAGSDARFHLPKGGLICSACFPVPGQITRLSGISLDLLDKLSALEKPESATTLGPDQQSKTEVEAFLQTFLHFHVSGMRALKSEKIFRILKTA